MPRVWGSLNLRSRICIGRVTLQIYRLDLEFFKRPQRGEGVFQYPAKPLTPGGPSGVGGYAPCLPRLSAGACARSNIP